MKQVFQYLIVAGLIVSAMALALDSRAAENHTCFGLCPGSFAIYDILDRDDPKKVVGQFGWQVTDMSEDCVDIQVRYSYSQGKGFTREYVYKMYNRERVMHPEGGSPDQQPFYSPLWIPMDAHLGDQLGIGVESCIISSRQTVDLGKSSLNAWRVVRNDRRSDLHGDVTDYFDESTGILLMTTEESDAAEMPLLQIANTNILVLGDPEYDFFQFTGDDVLPTKLIQQTKAPQGQLLTAPLPKPFPHHAPYDSGCSEQFILEVGTGEALATSASEPKTGFMACHVRAAAERGGRALAQADAHLGQSWISTFTGEAALEFDLRFRGHVTMDNSFAETRRDVEFRVRISEAGTDNIVATQSWIIDKSECNGICEEDSILDEETIYRIEGVPVECGKTYKWEVRFGLEGSTRAAQGEEGETEEDFQTIWSFYFSNLREVRGPMDVEPPYVSITDPADGDCVKEDVCINTQASDDIEVERVDFQIDDVHRHTDYDSPYTYDWSTREEADGQHAIKAVVYDCIGHSGEDEISVIVDNTRPTVDIVNPSQGDVFCLSNQIVPITVAASDNIGVDRVEIRLDGVLVWTDTTPPYKWLWLTLLYPDGDYEIEARAFDCSDNYTIQEITVTLDRTPPTVTITSPENGQTVTGITLFAVNATDVSGIQRVDFYVDGLLGFTDNAAPYAWDWNTTTYCNETHALKAIAYDGTPCAHGAADEIRVTSHNVNPLSIVENSIYEEYHTPPNPWPHVEKVEVRIHIGSSEDLVNVKMNSDDLRAPGGYSIDGYSISFTPEEIGILRCNHPMELLAYVPIPIGQHEGTYTGFIRATASGGATDAVLISLTVPAANDIDLDRHEVVVSAYPDESGTGLFVAVNPNSWDNNPDPVDGPGNTDFPRIMYHATPLVGAGGSTIPSSAVSFSNGEESLLSGECDEVFVHVNVPSGQLAGRYAGLALIIADRPGGTVQDSLDLKVDVLPQKALEIEETSVSGSVEPSSPWCTPLYPEIGITLRNTGNDTLTNISMSSSNFRDTDDSSPDAPLIPAANVSFDPPSVAVLPPGWTHPVMIQIEVPVGTKATTYRGTIWTMGMAPATAGGGEEEQEAPLSVSDRVQVNLSVGGLADVDIQDDKGSLSGNKMSLIGHFSSGGGQWPHIPFLVVSGTFNVVNPNMWSMNTSDPYDGPGNVDLSKLEYSWTRLECVENCPHDAYYIEPHIEIQGPYALPTGTSGRSLLHLGIIWWDFDAKPMGKHMRFLGTVTVSNEEYRISDEFTLELILGEDLYPGQGYLTGWGEDEGNHIEWRDFTMDELGYDVYRSVNGESFVKLNPRELAVSQNEYLDAGVVESMAYEYKLGLSLDDGSQIMIGPIGIRAKDRAPLRWALGPCMPNPFAGKTRLSYQIAKPGHVFLRIYDSSGRVLRTLVDGEKEPGFYTAEWDGRDESGVKIANGIYFCRLQAGGISRTRKMVLMR